MPDHRFPPNDPRHHGRADNAGFSVVIVLGGFLALGLMAAAIRDEGSARSGAVHTGQVTAGTTPASH
jgi:hypothetical protein